MCLNLGICGSPSGAITALKSLPWRQISTKRCIVSRSAVIDYFNDSLFREPEKTPCERRLNMSLALRQYQIDCLQSIQDNYMQGINRQLVHMATGAEKLWYLQI